MRRIIVALLCLGLTIAPATARTISKAEAQKKVANAEEINAQFLQRLPAFKAIMDAVETDCAAKAKKYSQSTTYCKCGAVVTMELWRSGIDPKMMQRLKDYAAHPEPAKANDFLQYQGPELYQPLCELAEPDG